MRVLEVFKARHAFARQIFYNGLWRGYTEAQLRMSVHPSTNSLAWILWHVARVEDAGVMRFVTREPQLFVRDQWKTRLRIDVDHFGYGMTNAAMRQLSEQIDLGALRAYFGAVVENTLGTLDRLTPEQLDDVLSDADVEAVMVMEGVGAEVVGTNVPYAGWTRLEALYHFSVTHYYWHGGEVRTILGLMRHELH